MKNALPALAFMAATAAAPAAAQDELPNSDTAHEIADTLRGVTGLEEQLPTNAVSRQVDVEGYGSCSVAVGEAPENGAQSSVSMRCANYAQEVFFMLDARFGDIQPGTVCAEIPFAEFQKQNAFNGSQELCADMLDSANEAL